MWDAAAAKPSSRGGAASNVRQTMATDQQGNPLSGASPAAAALFDAAVHSFNIYRGDPLARLDEAVAQSPAFAQAHLFKAFILALATEPAATGQAREIARHVQTMALNDREASQLAVLDRLIAGNWVQAAVAMDFHSMRHPRDLVGLQVGHLMDFYRGSARDLRDRLARAVPSWSTDVPGYHAVLAMYAFGLEETGDYARAEQTGRRALDLEPFDAWAHHAVAHVMEMQGRAEDGIGWMIAREPFWSSDDNFFKVHNWWHRALCHLDLGQRDVALALYDDPIRGSHSRVALDLIDASALLWRMHLCGVEGGDRWRELADCWDDHADGQLYPFNDLHAAIAYLGAGRDARLEELLALLEANAAGGADTSDWIRTVGLPLTRGFVAFWRGQYRAAVETLHPLRFIAHRFGGSHAQRDVIDWTLTEAALRADLPDVAASLAHERAALKPHSVVNRDFLRRAERRSAPSEALVN
jgi:tetratricopeptide (TPR) repeat protein